MASDITHTLCNSITTIINLSVAITDYLPEFSGSVVANIDFQENRFLESLWIQLMP